MISPGSHSSWPAGDRCPGHSPCLPGGALPDFPQSTPGPGPVSLHVHQCRPLWRCSPTAHSAPAWPSARCPASPAPLEGQGLFVSRGLSCLAALQGEVSQIRGPAPNPACWVLQGSEQLIMNLIKGEQEPQSDLGFSLGHHSAQMAWLCVEWVGCQAYSPC